MTRLVTATTVNKSKEDILAAIDVENFDWATYEGTYKGRALITRLHHIPNLLLYHDIRPTSHSLSFARAALIRLIPHVKTETWDHQLYLQAIGELEATLKQGQPSTSAVDNAMDVESPSGRTKEFQGIPDNEWVEETVETERKEGTRLDVELRGYLSNLIKESIRLTYLAFAQLSIKIGSAPNAVKSYNSSREYSSSPAHLVELGLGILETCLMFNQPNSLPGHISKLEAALDRLHPPVVASSTRTATESTTASDLRESRERESKSQQARISIMTKIKVAKVFLHLHTSDYARVSREVDGVIDNGGLSVAGWEGVVISSAELGLIGAVSGLASLDRGEVRRRLLDKTAFRTLLDDSMGWVMDLVRGFVEAKYSEVMGLLETAGRTMLLSPLLAPHTFTLITQIKQKSIIQYILPFSTVSIATMASAFNLPPDEMMRIVESLVESKKIMGKIDLIDQVLEIKSVDPRGELFDEALRVGKHTSETTKAALFRMKLIESKIIVTPRSQDSASTSTTSASRGRRKVAQTDSMSSLIGEDLIEGQPAGMEDLGFASDVISTRNALTEDEELEGGDGFVGADGDMGTEDDDEGEINEDDGDVRV